jgi:hypothetical protein
MFCIAERIGTADKNRVWLPASSQRTTTIVITAKQGPKMPKIQISEEMPHG